MSGTERKSTPARRRVLSFDERDLWQRVTRDVTPKRSKKKPQPVEPSIEATPAAPSKPRPSTDAKPVPGKVTPAALPAAPKYPAPLVELERRQKIKIAKGRTALDGKLDLHGMRLHEAHAALHSFILNAQARRARVLLVVTGKGGGKASDLAAPDRPSGVLRRSVPQWLGEPQLRSVVLGVEEAARNHGGAGALYVRLRKPRP